MEQYFAWKPPIEAKGWKPRAPRAPDDTHPNWQFFACPLMRAASGSTSHIG
jgi:hypothetical protein